MEGVRARLILHSGGFALGALLAAWTVARKMSVGYALAAISMMLLVLLVYTAAQYQTAGLIVENRLHSVSCVAVSESRDGEDARETAAVNVVISAFGILVGHRAYKFNRDGVRLLAMEIHRERIHLAFGNGEKQRSIILLHGFSSEAEAGVFRDAVAYETGVVAEVSGWGGEGCVKHS